MAADLEFAVPLGLMPPPADAPPDGRVVELTPKPTLPMLSVPSAASSQADEAADVTGQVADRRRMRPASGPRSGDGCHVVPRPVRLHFRDQAAVGSGRP